MLCVRSTPSFLLDLQVAVSLRHRETSSTRQPSFGQTWVVKCIRLLLTQSALLVCQPETDLARSDSSITSQGHDQLPTNTSGCWGVHPTASCALAAPLSAWVMQSTILSLGNHCCKVEEMLETAVRTFAITPAFLSASFTRKLLCCSLMWGTPCALQPSVLVGWVLRSPHNRPAGCQSPGTKQNKVGDHILVGKNHKNDNQDLS